jgi:hypothetical protein
MSQPPPVSQWTRAWTTVFQCTSLLKEAASSAIKTVGDAIKPTTTADHFDAALLYLMAYAGSQRAANLPTCSDQSEQQRIANDHWAAFRLQAGLVWKDNTSFPR